jgi:hypothetical protein
VNEYKILVLEDSYERIDEFKKRFNELQWRNHVDVYVDFCETVIDACKRLSMIKYDLIFLDHDLGGEVYVDSNNDNTGAEVARFLSNPDYDNKRNEYTPIIIHSLNTTAAIHMHELLGDRSTVIPFVWTAMKFHNNIRI